MKLEEIGGCYYHDKIDLELSPSELARLEQCCEQNAMNTSNYIMQGIWRDLKDYLEKRLSAWKNARAEKDKRGVT
jgi:hypothetical protein